MQEQTSYQFTQQLFQFQQFYMKAIPCQRRYVKTGAEKIILNHQLYLTNYRIIFVGSKNELFPMQIFIRDIDNTVKSNNEKKKSPLILFKITLKSQRNQVSNINILGFETDKQNVVEELQKYLQQLIKTEDKTQQQLKKQLLVSDKVLYEVYNNLVNNRKVITQDEFWAKHKYITQNRRDQKLQYQRFQQQKKPILIEKKISIKGRPEVESIKQQQIQGYSLQKQIQNLSLKTKSQEVNQSTKQSIIQEIQDMYLRDSTAYKNLKIVVAPQILSNQGIFVVPIERKMQLQQSKDNVINKKSPPIKIPIIQDVKFKIDKQQLIYLIKSSSAGIKYRKQMQSSSTEKDRKPKQRDLTGKVVSYVGIFYQMMRKKDGQNSNNQKLSKMHEQIQNLKHQIQKNADIDKGKQLLTFVNKALMNFLNHRKGQFYV